MMIPKECYRMYGSDLDACSRQENEGCSVCPCLEEGEVVWEISKEVEIAIAHYLPNHPGKCKFLHGHSLIVEVTVSGFELNNQGMLVDFGDLKKLVTEEVVDVLDHTCLNDLLEVPTVELLAKYLYNKLAIHFDSYEDMRVLMKSVTIKESSTSKVKYYKK